MALLLAVSLVWDASSEPDVAGYRIHWGQSSRNYTASFDVGKVTTFGISNQCGFFAVTAYNQQGGQSDYSNEVEVPAPAVRAGYARGMVLTWGASPGEVFRVFHQSELNGPWVPASPELVASGTSMEWRDGPGTGKRFYRLEKICK